MRKHNTVILFARAPKVCRVKTRLWPALSHRQCLYLHKQAVQHALRKMGGQYKYRLVVYTTAMQHGFQIPANVEIKLQSGLDLGQRMLSAIRAELKTTERVVLVGSDCPEMTVDYIEDAFARLRSQRDAVLGAANDGGYVLIGMRRPHPALFNNIVWGSPAVLQQTLHNAKRSGVMVHVLPSMTDIDSIQDLQLLQKSNRLPNWAAPLLSAY